MIYVDYHILGIVVNHGNRRKFTTIVMIYDDCHEWYDLCRKHVDEALLAMTCDDCHILAIDVNHSNRRKFATIAMIYVNCKNMEIVVNHDNK